MSITKSLLFLSLLTVISGCAHQDLADFPKRYHRDLPDVSLVTSDASFDEGKCEIVIHNDYRKQTASLHNMDCKFFPFTKQQRLHLEKAISQFTVIYGVEIHFSSGDGTATFFAVDVKSAKDNRHDWYGVQFDLWGRVPESSNITKREIALISDGSIYDTAYPFQRETKR